MNIPYHTRQTIKRIAVVILVVAAVLLVVWACWLVWLGRFFVYSRSEGAVLDFGLPSQMQEGELALPPQQETVPIFYNEGNDTAAAKKELSQIVGCYVQLDDLKKDVAAVKKQIQTLPRGTAVMVDVKNIYGSFFYQSEVGSSRSDQVDIEAMEDLIGYLDESGLYVIAKLPALRDYAYGLKHVSDGLPTSEGYLWMDEDDCYWLNPSSEGTISYLTKIIMELKQRGFDEVVFYDFSFPQTDRIVFSGDKNEALAKAAETLVNTCATEQFAVSFMADGAWKLPEGRCRMYVQNVDATEVDGKAQQLGIESPEARLLFLTDIHDTRFEKYSVLRPLAVAN